MTRQNIPIKPFSIAPLEKEIDLDGYIRSPELANSVSNEVCSSPGGCFLVTGYRGVGKTSFVNKVLQITKTKLSEKTIVVPVRLSLARGYSTDKLLRRLIRELFYAVNTSGLYDKLDIDSRQKLNTAFLRTSRQVKTALTQGLREAISKTEANTTRHSSENKFEAGIGMETIANLLGSFSSRREKEYSKGKTHSKETSNELGMEIEFLEYDDEIAESDLSDLINLFQNKKVETGEEIIEVTNKELRKPEWFWKILNKYFSSIDVYKFVSTSTSVSHYQNIKLLFVLDEIDKMSIDDAEQIFRSLKNLFLKGNVFFFLVTGKAFYYDWLRKRTSEDDIFFSLFTRIIHIPLFSDQEFDAIIKKIAEEMPTDLLVHLKYKAKGTPREFFRELSRFVDWSTEPPTISVDQTHDRLLRISGQLYPYIRKHCEVMENDERIDIGIKDHLRRSLHNWLEWITILVTFTKPAVVRPTTEGEKETDKVLLSNRAEKIFDRLLDSLIADGIVKDTKLKIRQEENMYTLIGQIREDLEETDSTISSQIPSAKVEQERNQNLLTLEFYQLLDNEKFDEAKKLLSRIRQYDSQEEVESAGLEKELAAREAIRNGDKLFLEKLFESAFGAYRIALSYLPDSREIKEKMARTKFALAFEQVEKANEYDTYLRARGLLEDAIASSHELFETDIAQMKKDAKEKMERINRIIYLQDNLSKKLSGGDYRDIKEDYNELISNAPNLRSKNKIQKQLMDIESGRALLDEARALMGNQEYDQAKDFAKKALASNNTFIAAEAEEILLRIESANLR